VKIQAILFDLGKVLVDFNFESGVQALHAACSISRNQFEEVLWDENCIRRYERGEISTVEFHAYLRDTAALSMDFEGFCRTWSSVFLPGLLVSENLLAALGRKYPLILVSNTNQVHIEYVRSNYSLLDHFTHHVLSYEVGALKPDRKIFERAIRLSGQPAEALFYTDDREENIEAAGSLGMHAHRFRTEAGLISALRGAGVEVPL
jgi:glucose-1-phosphatase